jgi:hypothetical protein
LILYGSYARGKAQPDSDVDLFVVLRQASEAAYEKVRQVAYRVMWQANFDYVFSLYLTDIHHYQMLERHGSSLETFKGKGKCYGKLPRGEPAMDGQSPSSLTAAKKLLEESLFAESISRSCYAMFYAAKALLLLDGIDVSEHSAVAAAFGKEYAKRGKIDPRYHRILLDSFEWR